ncbi:hypothetical protein SAMN04487904_11681 [Actinopolyspora lacussalsi subsp. righensis]|uniref:Uncharacterized protein n=1 Tax=Actinopolyspora righensis TaxID=995060 RepID=A0A1I7CBF7_9ACTN|nr:hypothetical protein [Actinopolyspora righensis]SFT96756.1 hypothetical protein SAMN04487904_11681 [Actinopolyspora righensis]
MRRLRAFWRVLHEFNADNVWLWQRYLSSLRPWEETRDGAADLRKDVRTAAPDDAARGSERPANAETPTPVG